MINEIMESSGDLKSTTVSPYALNNWFKNNDVTIIALFILPFDSSVLIVYTDREVEEEKHIRGFGD